MKRKYILAMFTLVVGLGLTACGSSDADNSQSTDLTPTAVVEETDTNSQEETTDTETGSNDGEAESTLTTVQGTYGYELQYNESMFDFSVADGKDSFTLKDQDLDSEPPVYVTVELHENTTVDDLINDTKSKCADDTAEITDAYFGAGNYETKSLFVELTDKEKKQFVTYYAVPSGDNALLVEISSYEDGDPAIDAAIEEMLGNFTIK